MTTYRELFPALADQTYLNTAGTGLMSTRTVEQMAAHYALYAAHGSAIVPELRKQVEHVRSLAAQLLHTQTHQIAFVPNTASGMHYLAQTLRGKKVALLKDDFPTVNSAWEVQGFDISYFEAAANGFIDLDTIRNLEADILAISHVQWHTGFKLPVREVAALCKEKGMLFILDATQSLGNTHLTVADGFDALLCSSYKWLMGGFGNAILYVSKAICEDYPVRLNWHFFQQGDELFLDARRFEFGHERFHTIIQMTKGLELLLEAGTPQIESRIKDLTHYLWRQFEEHEISLLSDFPTDFRSAISIMEGDETGNSYLGACKVRLSPRGRGLRVATHFYNTKEDIDQLIFHWKKR